MIDEAPSQAQHELFPLDPPAPVPEPVAARPKARKPEPLAPPAIEEEPDIEWVSQDAPPTATEAAEPASEPEEANPAAAGPLPLEEESDTEWAPQAEPHTATQEADPAPETEETAAPATGSLPMVLEYPLSLEVAPPPRRTVSLGLFVAGMSAMSLLLAVIALGLGIHATRTPSPHPNAEEEAVLARLAGVVAGVDPASVAVDAGRKRLQARAIRIPGAELSTYRALEERVQAQAPGWTVTIAPPPQPTPAIRFAAGADDLSAGAERAIQATAWAAQRWGFTTVGVPGLVEPRPRRALLPQRRAQAVAALLDRLGLKATPLASEGQSFRLHLPWPQQK